VAPTLLGAGSAAVADLGIATIGDALRPAVTDVTVLAGADGEQPNVRITMALR
jgi:diaminohydroxyphosphoribosylaminopyrimidine deaminase / 5-amino-6-(5-phosphoribosylamino)uracil reductase